jgi:2-polyprenyl-6-methoxyphenol hydroxylase-like FAD-dependent oxidoreductase
MFNLASATVKGHRMNTATSKERRDHVGSVSEEPEQRFPILVVGAGPVGLTLALELERLGVEALLIERNQTTTRHPKMDITNGRSMEFYRRLGIAEDLRKVAVPADHPRKVTWVTKLTEWELASFSYPSVEQSREQVRASNDGTMPLEPDMRVSQIVLEPALKEILEARARHVTVRYGWNLESFAQDADGVHALVRAEDGNVRKIHADYLIGCDGAGSVVRKQLTVGLDEIDLRRHIFKELGPVKAAAMTLRAYLANRELPMDGRIYMVHFTTNHDLAERFGMVWHVQSPEGWTLISQNDGDTWTLHSPLSLGTDAEKLDPKKFVCDRLGAEFDMDVLVANAWTPRLTLAHSYGRGRAWLAGDAVHQVTPAGGYGMNTGVGDAIGLAWVLAAVLAGWGSEQLLQAYDIERRRVAHRNREASARHSVVRLAVKVAFRASMHSERWLGQRTRQRIGREISDLGNLENEALGIEIGYRYDTSPIICHEGGEPPAQRMDQYTPTTWPGARPPSLYLSDGRAIYDLFGRGFTLLRFADIDVDSLLAAAASQGVPLDVVDIDDSHARTLYERDLVLLRPDQHVAWRGDAGPEDPVSVIERIRGAHPTSRNHRSPS